tara:strand:- start:1157 stop:1792 length:636 start_codon:yes stop_codon:yes gene_type:complete
MSEFGYIPESPTQSWGSNKGIFTPNDIYNLDLDSKFSTVGSLELIETKTGSGVSAIDFTSIKESFYNVHFLTITDFQVATDGQPMGLRFSTDGGSSYVASGYQWATENGQANGTFYQYYSTSSTYLEINRFNGNTTNEKANAFVYLYNLGKSYYSYMNSICSYTSEYTARYAMQFGGQVYPTNGVVDSIRLLTTSGNMTASAVSLYGLRYQ